MFFLKVALTVFLTVTLSGCLLPRLDWRSDTALDCENPSVWYVDIDSDGFGDGNSTQVSCVQPEGYVSNLDDCNDGNEAINPNAEDVCDGFDNDCNSESDDGPAPFFYADDDEDGFGDPKVSLASCDDLGKGWVSDSSDCNDGDSDIHPGAEEFCDDPTNYDCVKGNEPVSEMFYLDSDHDGFGAVADSLVTCEKSLKGYVLDSTDCNDSEFSVHPGADEVCNGIDDDCDDEIDDADADVIGQAVWYFDADLDGFGGLVFLVTCFQPKGYTTDSTDCDDSEFSVHPGADEVCNGIDDDCDDEIDDADFGVVGQATWYFDADSDGFGGPSWLLACFAAKGCVTDSTDCNDSEFSVHPGADEVCNRIDDDCDGIVDEDDASDATTWYRDADEDGFGDTFVTFVACDMPVGFVADDADCDDSHTAVHPSVVELCNGIDDDCSGVIDDGLVLSFWYLDSDHDGLGDVDNLVEACESPEGYVVDSTDCNDSNASVHPDADELCNGFDDNCDGVVDEPSAIDSRFWWLDADGDGYGNNGSPETVPAWACIAPIGYVADHTDCDDSDPDVNIAATEYCDGIDNDCNEVIDEDDASDATTWYRDADEDDFGDASVTFIACEAPVNFVVDHTDCDDLASDINPSAEEIYHNGIDEDCDGADNLWFVEDDTFCMAQTVFSGCFIDEAAYFVGESPLGSWSRISSTSPLVTPGAIYSGFLCLNFYELYKDTPRYYEFVIVSSKSVYDSACETEVDFSRASGTWYYGEGLNEYCEDFDDRFCNTSSSYSGGFTVCLFEDGVVGTPLTPC